MGVRVVSMPVRSAVNVNEDLGNLPGAEVHMTKPFLVWREGWLVGIERIDADHQKLLELLNLLARCPDGDAGDSVLQRLEAVIAHLRQHFEYEEAFLRAMAYPEYEAHSRAHALELAELTVMMRSVREQGGGALGDESLVGLKHWFCDHVIGEDHRYAEYYFRLLDEQTHAQVAASGFDHRPAHRPPCD